MWTHKTLIKSNFFTKSNEFNDTKEEQMAWLTERRLCCNSSAANLKHRGYCKVFPPPPPNTRFDSPQSSLGLHEFSHFISNHLDHMTRTSPSKGIKLFNVLHFKPEKHILQVLNMFPAIVAHRQSTGCLRERGEKKASRQILLINKKIHKFTLMVALMIRDLCYCSYLIVGLISLQTLLLPKQSAGGF